MTDVHEQRWFEQLLRRVGTPVRVHLVSGEQVHGRVRNASFDSFLLNTDSGVVCVRYQDILVLEDDKVAA